MKGTPLVSCVENRINPLAGMASLCARGSQLAPLPHRTRRPLRHAERQAPSYGMRPAAIGPRNRWEVGVHGGRRRPRRHPTKSRPVRARPGSTAPRCPVTMPRKANSTGRGLERGEHAVNLAASDVLDADEQRGREQAGVREQGEIWEFGDGVPPERVRTLHRRLRVVGDRDVLMVDMDVVRVEVAVRGRRQLGDPPRRGDGPVRVPGWQPGTAQFDQACGQPGLLGHLPKHSLVLGLVRLDVPARDH